MDGAIRIFIAGIVVLLIIMSGVPAQFSLTSPISCYTCSTANNPGCEDPARISSYYMGCPSLPGQDRCVKIVGPGLQVARRCGGYEPGQIADGCFANGEALICVCSTNYCNGGLRINRLSSVAIGFVAVVVTLGIAGV